MNYYKDECEWRERKSADEQLACVANWADYEDYDIVCRCKSMEVLIALYRFINFEIGVEFWAGVQDLIDEELEDGDTTTLDKCLAWDEQHQTDFFYDPRNEEYQLNK